GRGGAARRGAAHARAAVEAELDGLVDQREALRVALDILNRHIDDQRERIRAGIAELRRIVDDDGRLTPGPVPAFADVDRPAAPPLPSRAPSGCGPPRGGRCRPAPPPRHRTGEKARAPTSPPSRRRPPPTTGRGASRCPSWH